VKRFGHLYDAICAWDNLELAARRARKRKRYRWYAEDFELRRESVLREVHDELVAQRWQPAPYETFRIYDPKERLICAAPYRDRIVHHAVCNIVAPLLERSFIAHSYACRVVQHGLVGVDEGVFPALPQRSAGRCLKLLQPLTRNVHARILARPAPTVHYPLWRIL
jgi:hypothetical protein